MTDSHIQLPVPADNTGAKLDSTRITRPDGVVVERQRLDVVNRYHQKISDTKTVTGAGTRLNFTAYGPVTEWALQVSGTGAAPTAWTVNLEISLDGVTFQRVIQHTTTDLNGAVKFATGFAALHAQIYVASLQLGTATDIVITALGT